MILPFGVCVRSVKKKLFTANCTMTAEKKVGKDNLNLSLKTGKSYPFSIVLIQFGFLPFFIF